ncbi:MAG TPA: hypothetical protein VFV01_47785 [Spirillospora sp.]|nr:hypothetical protein [Spirillospora sp.]
MSKPRRTSPADRLAAHLAATDAAARVGGRPRALIIPILDDDPPADDPTNLWAFDDGRLRFRGSDGTVHEFVPLVDQGYRIKTLASTPAASTGIDFWVGTGGTFHVRQADGTVLNFQPTNLHTSTSGGGSTDGGGTTTKTKQVDTAPKTYRRTWDASWGRIICPVHGVELGSHLRYGRYDSTHGERRIMIGLPDADIRSSLAGAKVKKVELHMVNTDSYSHSGIEVYFGGHNQSGPPNGYSSVREQVVHGHWPESGGGTYWRSNSDMLWFGQRLRDNVIKGLTINQPSGSLSYYGEMAWASVRLRITYVK